MPQAEAIVTADMMSLAGENGICTSHRRPPVSVSVGVARQESCAKTEYRSIRPSRWRGPNRTYRLFAGSSAICEVSAGRVGGRPRGSGR